MLRPYWKCLQDLNGIDPSQTLSAHLAKWDEDHRKDVKFFDLKNKPKTYALYGFHPFQTDEENARLDKLIDQIIETTDLYVPERKLCSVGWKANNCELVGDYETAELVPQLVVAQRKFSAGIVVLHSPDLFVNYFRSLPQLARKLAPERIKKSSKFINPM